MTKIKKPKKVKLPTKTCIICGENTTDYIIYKNGIVCSDCQENGEFDKLKEKTK